RSSWLMARGQPKARRRRISRSTNRMQKLFDTKTLAIFLSIFLGSDSPPSRQLGTEANLPKQTPINEITKPPGVKG
ncbi:hypothetical protein, partial [Planococcus maritimus]|uniref:hypothetical protein n=1 Tax=Planococcus maritimus TaxID=192421 RepID=UPI00232F7870